MSQPATAERDGVLGARALGEKGVKTVARQYLLVGDSGPGAFLNVEEAPDRLVEILLGAYPA